MSEHRASGLAGNKADRDCLPDLLILGEHNLDTSQWCSETTWWGPKQELQLAMQNTEVNGPEIFHVFKRNVTHTMNRPKKQKDRHLLQEPYDPPHDNWTHMPTTPYPSRPNEWQGCQLPISSAGSANAEALPSPAPRPYQETEPLLRVGHFLQRTRRHHGSQVAALVHGDIFDYDLQSLAGSCLAGRPLKSSPKKKSVRSKMLRS